jgi:hypothetical protein
LHCENVTCVASGWPLRETRTPGWHLLCLTATGYGGQVLPNTCAACPCRGLGIGPQLLRAPTEGTAGCELLEAVVSRSEQNHCNLLFRYKFKYAQK